MVETLSSLDVISFVKIIGGHHRWGLSRGPKAVERAVGVSAVIYGKTQIAIWSRSRKSSLHYGNLRPQVPKKSRLMSLDRKRRPRRATSGRKMFRLSERKRTRLLSLTAKQGDGERKREAIAFLEEI